MLGIVDGVNYYGCCKCQVQHFEEDSVYQEHILHQSKSGVQKITRQHFEDIRDSANFSELKTPNTHPDHDVVGHTFRGWNGTYFCDSYDKRMGFWMTNIEDPSDRRNVSERAIGRTFHKVKNKKV